MVFSIANFVQFPEGLRGPPKSSPVALDIRFTPDLLKAQSILPQTSSSSTTTMTTTTATATATATTTT